MKPKDLEAWVAYIQGLHLRSIDLSLERVNEVYQNLYPDGIKPHIVSLAGTNGKGSSAELLASIYAAAGYRVGKYSSPHLVDFSERYEINRKPVDDVSLVNAFEEVERARKNVPLTFFEFGTLLAIHLFAQADLDVIIMEVGLGGRLDAVNILDADISLITNVSIDHTSWLGDSIEKIALEKAGIARAGRPAIVASSQPPSNLLAHLEKLGAKVYARDSIFSIEHQIASEQWSWRYSDTVISDLPLPFSQSGVQLDNAAGALMVVELMQSSLPVTHGNIKSGLQLARLAGRCELVDHAPTLIFDVSHNEASLQRLAEFVVDQWSRGSDGKCVAVCGMLKDKEIAKSLEHMKGIVDNWYLGSIQNERGSKATELQAILSDQQQVFCFDYIVDAYQAALEVVKECDCLVVFGSFHVVGDIISHRKKLRN